MTPGGYSPAMLRLRAVVASLAVGLLAGCSGDGESDSTLGPLESPTSAPAVTPTVAVATTASPASDTAPSGAVGSGFVSIRVRLASWGIEESLTLDRASVPAAELDPLSVDAFCTALDEGEGWTVSVTDLRRLSVAGNRLVSAHLHIDGPVAGPAVYEGTLEVGDTGQQVTTYGGPVTLDEGLASGSFDLRDASGAAATGTFVCAPEPVATTTVAPTTMVDSVPPDSAVATVPAPPSPPVPTVPEATS